MVHIFIVHADSEALRKESRQLAREILSSMKPKKQECHSDRIESSGDSELLHYR